jgi:hypothetical protein
MTHVPWFQIDVIKPIQIILDDSNYNHLAKAMHIWENIMWFINTLMNSINMQNHML